MSKEFKIEPRSASIFYSNFLERKHNFQTYKL